MLVSRGGRLQDSLSGAGRAGEHNLIEAGVRGRPGSLSSSLSVVDGKLKVYGIDRLRVADSSIMPRVTTGNTMAPRVVIGERAGDILKRRHGL
jgi:GMC oxidoreductase